MFRGSGRSPNLHPRREIILQILFGKHSSLFGHYSRRAYSGGRLLWTAGWRHKPVEQGHLAISGAKFPENPICKPGLQSRLFWMSIRPVSHCNLICDCRVHPPQNSVQLLPWIPGTKSANTTGHVTWTVRKSHYNDKHKRFTLHSQSYWVYHLTFKWDLKLQTESCLGHTYFSVNAQLYTVFSAYLWAHFVYLAFACFISCRL